MRQISSAPRTTGGTTAPYGRHEAAPDRPDENPMEGIHMPTHTKAIREYELRHAVSEVLGFLGVTLYLGVVTGVIAQVAIFAGVLN